MNTIYLLSICPIRHSTCYLLKPVKKNPRMPETTQKFILPCLYVKLMRCLKGVTDCSFPNSGFNAEESMRNGLIGCKQSICSAPALLYVLHRAIISLLQQGSSDGLYDPVLLEHLKSACLLLIYPC